MCTMQQLNQITSRVTHGAKKILGNKLRNVILYGSYARGDYNEDSDVDIMLLADVENEDTYPYKKKICEITSDLALEHNALICVSIKDKRFFDEHIHILPFYQNVMKDGVILYG